MNRIRALVLVLVTVVGLSSSHRYAAQADPASQPDDAGDRYVLAISGSTKPPGLLSGYTYRDSTGTISSAGANTLTGYDVNGKKLFEYSFDAQAIPGANSYDPQFTLSVPIGASIVADLFSLTLRTAAGALTVRGVRSPPNAFATSDGPNVTLRWNSLDYPEATCTAQNGFIVLAPENTGLPLSGATFRSTAKTLHCDFTDRVKSTPEDIIVIPITTKP